MFSSMKYRSLNSLTKTKQLEKNNLNWRKKKEKSKKLKDYTNQY